ncbi:hypothetical protein NA57DRAFT_59247 [Rhizodiscina lignyota]|uniref:Uncharacterized protein n=1 Tax=Rhizodiscina lignyota TaxID=1504668 RepID=A0A9P4M3Y0_9PEZI|nr:hypothetical protein NA57DRAFT_59247 [Rhizodiscina lignyota]
MGLIYAVQVYNHIVQEIRQPIRWFYPAAISVSISALNGTTQGLLVVFLLWQLTPILLKYGNASDTRCKWTIRFCYFLTCLINAINIADIVVTAIRWVFETQKAYNISKDKNFDKAEDKLVKLSGFTGMLLICMPVFAAVVYLAIKLFSVIAYSCILFLAMMPPPPGIDHDNVAVGYLPEKQRHWHLRLSPDNAASRFIPLMREEQNVQDKGRAYVTTVEEIY